MILTGVFDLEKEKIFEVLGIEVTNDKEKLRQAYRGQLVHHHPEDDPEGFKALRTAYEEAMALADKKEEEQQQAAGELSPGEQWIAQAEKRYARLSLRKDVDGWKQWLADDYCVALDTAEEARERFLQFALSHFYYPDEVWKVFDREFQIVADKKQLEERFPESFLDYAVWNIRDGVFIDFDLFEGDDEADFDGYIRHYYDLKYAVEAGNVGQAADIMKVLDDYPIRHEYVDVEQMKLAMAQEKWQEVENWICLFEAREDDNIYICLMMAVACERLEQWEKAEEMYDRLLQKNPDAYAAGMGRARCRFHDGKYQEAKELVLDLLEISKNDEQGQQLMMQINEQLIAGYLSREQELSAKDQIDLAWCYLQNEQYEKAVAIVESLQDTEAVQAEYNNLAGRVYLYMQQEEKALPYLQLWLEELDQIDASDGEKKDRKRRLPYAHFCVGLCYEKISQNDPELTEKGLAYIDRAIETEKDQMMRLSYLSSKAEWMNKLERYNECVAICDTVLAEDKRYLPAYIMRQEAAFELHQGQSVVDDYYRIIELFPNYPKCYLLAAKTFYYYKEYKDALDIIRQAEDAGQQTDSLVYLKAKCNYYLSENAGQAQEVAETYEELLKSQELTDDEKEQLRIDLAECLIYMRDFKTALVRVERFIGEYPDNHTLLWIKADVLQYLEKYEEALKAYEGTRNYFPENPGILFDLAKCQMMVNHYEDAIKRFREVLQLDEQYRDANGYLMEAYHQLMLEKEDVHLLDEALPYADRQIELTPTEYDYIQRGILYQDGGKPEKAIEDFMAALEINPESAYATNNLGFDYRLVNRFDEAIEMLERSLKLRREQELPLKIVYQNMAVTWLIMGNYERAAQVLKENIKNCGRNYNAEYVLAEVYHRAGQYLEALKTYEEMIRQYPEETSGLMVESAHVYAAMGDIRKSEKIIKAEYKKNKNDEWYFREYVEYLAEVRRDFRKVLQVFRSEPAVDDMRKKIGIQHLYIEALWRVGKKKHAEKAMEAMFDMLRGYGEEKYYGIDNQPMYRFNIAMGLLFGGKAEEAEQIFKEMLNGRRCRSCHYCQCFEALYGLGYVRLMAGQADEAYGYFQKALAVNPEDAICCYYGKEKRKQL